MAYQNPVENFSCQRLRDRTALNVILDETVLSAFSETISALRDGGDPLVPEFEHVVRSHRIGIIKQRAILGAAGIDL
ncbi:hypothetical protein FV222_10900 [Methylobacterium sp. WL103]|uniref:hypothetical protein n=1 Tax=Methylobacterium sp. WL103 TaxID=2603891 RepID=UPI0011CAAF5F|nr:hypothetical protein [Methylobacterium sp. WL103]TXN01225.1 hypothetical protein FV222_10900 [Methylobacterium sp. WL103]